MDAAPPPDRIGLLVGVPTTLDEFKARVDTSDFLSRYALPPDASEPSKVHDAAWEHRYGPMIGSPLHDLLDAARGLKVQVCPRATLGDIARISATCRIVIVLTHWKGSEILFEDLDPKCTVASIVEHARRHHSPLADWLAEQTGDDRRRAWFFSRRKTPTALALLRQAVELGWQGELVKDGVDGRSALPITLAARRRAEIDKMLEGLIQPGNRIELFDGLHLKETFEAALAPGFSGFLDLTTCTSTILGDHLSQRRGGALRLLEFPEQQELLWHAHCVVSALEMTIHESLPYPDARPLANSVLKQALDELAQRRPIACTTTPPEEQP